MSAIRTVIDAWMQIGAAVNASREYSRALNDREAIGADGRRDRQREIARSIPL